MPNKSGDKKGSEPKMGRMTRGHSGTIVLPVAFGPHAVMFSGFNEKADQGRIMANLLKI